MEHDASDPEAFRTSAQSSADLHVHSKHSDRPSEWVLRRIGAPECFVEPRRVYDMAKSRGMDFVTITDHNCISGALEIAELPGTFVSTEVTTYFPEDGCKIHCLVFDITEAQFADIQQVRENIYDFREYVAEQDILYSVSHPLFSVNDRLTADHVEKLILLFSRFEGLNGTRHVRAGALLNLIFRGLTPESIERLANRHGIEPFGPEPWRKLFTGGSDDHSGLYVASAHTVTPQADSLQEFLEHLRLGRHDMSGSNGTSLKLAHSFYQIAYSFYKNRFFGDQVSGQPNLLGSLFRQMLEPTSKTRVSFGDRARRLFGNLRVGWHSRRLNDMDKGIIREFAALFRDGSESPESFGIGQDHRAFHHTCQISQQLSFAFVQRFGMCLAQGAVTESLQSLASLGPVLLSITPYMAAFGAQHKDAPLLRSLGERFNVAPIKVLGRDMRAWLTDTKPGGSGVPGVVRETAESAARSGFDVTVVTCHSGPLPWVGSELRNFPPVGIVGSDEPESVSFAFPPFLEIIEYLERQHFSELIVSSPGPLGLTGLAAARLLGLRVTAVCHVDFVQDVLTRTEDDLMAQLASRYLNWFYRQTDTVLCTDEALRESLLACGVDELRVTVLPPGRQMVEVLWGGGVGLSRATSSPTDSSEERREDAVVACLSA